MPGMTDEAGSRRGVRIYRGADAADPLESGFHAANDFSAQPELVPAAVALGRAGGAVNRLMVRQSADEGGFSLLYAWFKPHFPLFRHRHDTDCLYVVVSGSLVMGSQELRTGDSFFVAAGTPYGYTAGPEGVEVLEVRHGADSFTFIAARNPQGQIDRMHQAAREQAGTWATMTDGPMFRADGEGG
jgi:mannose-6-phosphate isomerase-like protein (cupin superfamily)